MAHKSVWGVDIGRYSVKAVRLDRKKNEFEVGATDIIPYRTLPLFDSSVTWEELVTETMRELLFRQRIGETPMVVSLTGHQIFNRTIEITVTDPKRLPELVKHEAKQQIPGDIDEVIWTYEDVSDPMDPDKEVALFALRRDVVDGFVGTLQSVPAAPVGMTVSPLAIFNFIGYDVEPSEPLVVLDIGCDMSDLLVVSGRRVWVRQLRTAGNDFTKALRDATGKDLPSSEKLKRQIARHEKRDVLAKTLEPVYTQLVSEIQRSLGFYKQQAEETVDFDRLLVLGGGSKTHDMNRQLQRGLQMQVESLTDVTKLRVGAKTDANLFSSNLPMLPGALGLALQGHGASPYNVDLLPERITRARDLEGKKGWALAAGAIVLLGGLTQFGMLKVAEGGMTAANDDLRDLKKSLQTREAQLSEARNHEAAIRKLEYYESILAGRGIGLEVLQAIYSVLPEELDENPVGRASVNEARRGLSSLEMSVQAPNTEKVTETDPDTEETMEVTYDVQRLKVLASFWYHLPAGGAPTGPSTEIQAAIQAKELPGFSDKDAGGFVPRRVSYPGGPEDPEGKFGEFQYGFYVEISRKKREAAQ